MAFTRECFLNHLGLWACEEDFMVRAVANVKAGLPPFESRHLGEDEDLFGMGSDGVAIVEIAGPMMKWRSKFGGASTIAIRRALRQAMQTEEVSAVMLYIESPGGHVAGTQELADDVRELQGQFGKPIHAHIEDLGASAAYWVASQAASISANASADIGSIGIIAELVDSSGAAEAAGLVVHPITTGEFKGMGAEGVPVTDRHLAEVQRRVDQAFVPFRRSVMEGRGMDADAFKAVSDGRVHGAADAVKLGLIDRIASAEEAMASHAAPKRRAAAAWVDDMRAQG